MIPAFIKNGCLPPGIHWATWQEVCESYGGTPARDRLLKDMKPALANLRAAGCSYVYLDGSFVTAKAYPTDCDVCFDSRGVDDAVLDPVLTEIDYDCRAQKLKYGCQFFPANLAEGKSGKVFLLYFQEEEGTGNPKGIVAIDLRSAKL